MTLRTDSLWSPDILPGILSPREILEVQADALRQQTESLLAAEVIIVHDRDESAVQLTLDIAVPALEGSRHRVLTARHFNDRIYPCRVDAESQDAADVAHSPEELRELVRQILNSDTVKSLALSLIDRARQTRRPDLSVTERRHNGHKRLYRPAWAGVAVDEEDADEAIAALYDEPQGID